jgi:hypothetical protein
VHRVPRFIVIVGVLLAIPASILLIHHSRSRGALTRYKAELKAKGAKLTFAELAIPPSTNVEHIRSREIFATNTFPTPGAVPSVMEFVASGKARVSWRSELHLASAAGTKSPPIPGAWAELESQNGAFAASLDRFRQALEDTTPDTGWIYTKAAPPWNGPRINFVLARAVAHGLLSVEIGELHRGNLPAAVRNLHALAGLARLNRNELTLPSHMIRIAISDLGLHGTWEALQAPNWDDAQLALLQRDWERVDLLEAIERGFLGERAFGSAFIETVRKSRGREFSGFFHFSPVGSPGGAVKTNLPVQEVLRDQFIATAYRATSMDEDELFYLSHVSRLLEATESLKANRPWSEVGPVVSNLCTEIEAGLNTVYHHRFMVSQIAVPNSNRAIGRAVQAETLRRLTITAIALKRFELRHGHPAPSLTALLPEFLPAVPMDPMSGRPLCYQPNADGTFVLYSVGEDGKDDGGQAGLDLWSGPDAVWPDAAKEEPPATTPKATATK